MRDFILVLSVIALLISAVWVIQSGFDYEPIIVFLLGLVGILYHIFNSSNDKNKQEPSLSNISNSAQNVVTVNLGRTEKEIKQKNHNTDPSPEKASNEREAKIEFMKNKLNILFIDDDKNFEIVKVLKDNGWKNTKTVVDIKGVDIPVVKNSDIYFVDINGVGKLMNLDYEGLDIALMLKQRYPDKKVVIYSANKEFNAFHDAWEECDYKLEKNALPYQFQNLVENYSIEIYSRNQ